MLTREEYIGFGRAVAKAHQDPGEVLRGLITVVEEGEEVFLALECGGAVQTVARMLEIGANAQYRARRLAAAHRACDGIRLQELQQAPTGALKRIADRAQAVVDLYGVGISPERFCEAVEPLMQALRLALHSLRPQRGMRAHTKPGRPEVADGTFYAEDGIVWKAPIRRQRDGFTQVEIGFPVCVMHEAVGDRTAETVAAMMNLACFGQAEPRLSSPVREVPLETGDGG